jgi:hypothetical protein
MSTERARAIGSALLKILGNLQATEDEPPVAIVFVVMAPDGNWTGCASHASEADDLALIAIAADTLTKVSRKHGN